MPSLCPTIYSSEAVKYSFNLKDLIACCCCDYNGTGRLVLMKNVDNNYLQVLASIHWPNRLLSLDWFPYQSSNLVCASSTDGTIQVYEVPQLRNAVAIFLESKGEVVSVDWGWPYIASASADSTIRVWDITSKCLLLTCQIKTAVNQVKWQPTSINLVAGVCENNCVMVWDTNSNQCALVGNCGTMMWCCAWCEHNSNVLATAGESGVVELWDTRQFHKPVQVLAAHTEPVSCLAWSSHIPNILATGSLDKETRIWDTLTGNCLERVAHHSDHVHDIDFDPFQPWQIADCGKDGLVHVFTSSLLLSATIAPRHIPNKL